MTLFFKFTEKSEALVGIIKSLESHIKSCIVSLRT